MKRRNYLSIALVSLLVISQSLTSCLFGIRGNGKVVKSERKVEHFHAISVSSGIDLNLSQDSLEKVLVDADENLQDVIKTEVSNGKLKIYPREHISHASSMKVYVTMKNINSLQASSGSDVKTVSRVNLTSFKISASSGADIKIEISCGDLQTDGSSGCNIALSGKTAKLSVESSSGSNINAGKLNSETCSVDASSGSRVRISVSKKIDAHASSGSDITIDGNPAERNVEKSSGGSVTFK
jgi:hypothetical protein